MKNNSIIHELKSIAKPIVLDYKRQRAISKWKIKDKHRISNYLDNNPCPKLQFGSGHNALNGWLNTDLVSTDALVYCDMNERLPFEDNSFQFIFLEHCIGYLTLPDCKYFVSELFRIVKPNGVVRIQTPDFNKLCSLTNPDKNGVSYLNWYSNKFNVDTKIDAGNQILNYFFKQAYGTYIHSEKSLSQILSINNFSEVRVCDPIKSVHPELTNISYHHKLIPEEQNKFETLCIEATKKS